MELAQQVRLDHAKRSERSHDLSILLGFSVLSVLLLIAIILAAGGPGTAIGDFASMIVFP